MGAPPAVSGPARRFRPFRGARRLKVESGGRPVNERSRTGTGCPAASPGRKIGRQHGPSRTFTELSSA